MRRAALVLLAASLVAFAPAPFPRKPRHPTVADDLRAMRGEWVLDHALLRGETVWPSERGWPAAVWQIEGDQLAETQGFRCRTSTIQLGDSSPRSIDRQGTRNALKPGVYSLRGGTLVVSFGDERPADFSGRPPSDGVMVFKRREP